mmetsp:Transcript_26404/g.41006  ORF Transcript_26404/g.41006 Transcript_26404/m.41006 type:complete len:101 (+) Transcript_26404:637-939(+)
MVGRRLRVVAGCGEERKRGLLDGWLGGDFPDGQNAGPELNLSISKPQTTLLTICLTNRVSSNHISSVGRWSLSTKYGFCRAMGTVEHIWSLRGTVATAMD